MTSHVVIDGSNIATEGRKLPNLKQLDQAVAAFLKEHPHDNHTVVVDATFGHRISTRERSEYDERISTGKMITPPAGAIGRGDAFVLEIAERAQATVLSNDSFQEFHGQHDWLFDEGRLIGGKPVTGIGWVFVFRAPVRGATSRRAVRDARSDRGRSGGGRNTRNGAARTNNRRSSSNSRAPKKAVAKKPTPSKTLNDFVPFIEFVGANPIGATVEGTIERFSSHGAYADVGGAHCYIPLKSISDPAPRSAREIFEIGQNVEFVVASIDTPRRGIDLGMPGFTPPTSDGNDEPDERQSRDDIAAEEAKPSRRRRRKPAPDDVEADIAAEKAQRQAAATRPDGSKPRIGERRRAVKGPAAKRSKRAAEAAAKESATSPAVDTQTEAETVTPKKATTKKAAAKKTPAKKTATKKASPKASTTKQAKKAPAKKAVAKKTPAKKAAAKKASAKKVATTEAAAGDSMRIYELSKELDRPNKEILAACADLDIAAKSHSSSISGDDAARLRNVLNVASAATQKKKAARKKPSRATA